MVVQSTEVVERCHMFLLVIRKREGDSELCTQTHTRAQTQREGGAKGGWEGGVGGHLAFLFVFSFLIKN